MFEKVLPNKKIYIAGCGGMLGDAFYKEFKSEYNLKCSDINTNEDWISFLDFRDFKSYKNEVIEFSPDYLFHLGAYTDLEYCEKNHHDTYVTNTKSVEYALTIAKELNIPLLFISTAGIFDGKKDVYDESDMPNPMGHYAKSKFLAEKYLMENSKHYLICRAGWMMGGGPTKDKKFIYKLIKQIENGVSELNIVNDKLGTPTYTHDFARNVKLLIQKGKSGLYNMVCQGVTSRLDVAHELLKQLDLKNKIKITEVSSDFFKKEFFAPRPPSERLINARLEKEGLSIMRNWEDSLKEYIEISYNENFKLFSSK
ncbi:MAG: NAD(P)-dependent oxidoreductase [Candidatus Marinimicrobia bacterium]|nr:NAD(P)-dependent oxidoreductase [Candidatus Neomarinimicrobiota bacterium]|tara:strand:+ start:24108 stop:25043 length:936 start_codon:yes stop_codon:yes gene_type:complete